VFAFLLEMCWSKATPEGKGLTTAGLNGAPMARPSGMGDSGPPRRRGVAGGGLSKSACPSVTKRPSMLGLGADALLPACAKVNVQRGYCEAVYLVWWVLNRRCHSLVSQEWVMMAHALAAFGNRITAAVWERREVWADDVELRFRAGTNAYRQFLPSLQ